jgi:hypothetical protein
MLRDWATSNRHATVSTDAFIDHAEAHSARAATDRHGPDACLEAGKATRELLETWLRKLPLPAL